MQKLINHNYEKDLKEYPQYQHALNFIICHKPFDTHFISDISNKIFLTAEPEFAKQYNAVLIKSEYDTHVMGELPFIKYIANYLRDGDWACINHYRRKIYSKQGIQVAAPMQFNCSVFQQLSAYHSPLIVEAMHKCLSPQELNILNQNKLFPYNIFHAPKELLQAWVAYVEPRLLNILGCMGIKALSSQSEICEFIKNNKSFTEQTVKDKNIDINYQSRIGGFIVERLNTIFWQLQTAKYNTQSVVTNNCF